MPLGTVTTLAHLAAAHINTQPKQPKEPIRVDNFELPLINDKI